MADEPKRHGGKRPGAGRRFKYGEPTQPLRIPRRLAPAVERWPAPRRSRRWGWRWARRSTRFAS